MTVSVDMRVSAERCHRAEGKPGFSGGRTARGVRSAAERAPAERPVMRRSSERIVRRDPVRVAAGYQVPCGRPRGEREGWWLACTAVLTFSVVVLAGFFGPGGGESVPAQTAVVRVGTGDTLWSIAERIAPSSDPRDVVQRIVELNDLDASVAHAGQSLVVPVVHS